MEQDGEIVYAASFGLGAIVNCYFPLLNLSGGGQADHVQFDRAGILRHDPGAGAFTPFHDRPGISMKKIEAG